MRRFSAATLTLLLLYSIAVLWVAERWAWSLFQVSIFTLAAAWLIFSTLWRVTVTWSATLIPIASTIAWGALQLAFDGTVYRWNTWLSILDWATWLAAAFVALQVFVKLELRCFFLRVVTYFALVLSVVSSIQMITSKGRIYWIFPSGYLDFVLGPFVSRNQYAAFMELVIPVVLWHALNDRQRAPLYWMTASVIFASVVLGASRAGSILMVIEIVTFLTIATARRYLSAVRAALAFGKFSVFFAVFTVVLGWEVLSNRLWDPDPFAGRREVLWSSVAMIRARPVWGFGLGNWATAYPQYAYFDNGTYINQAHNDWVQWAGEGGIPLLLMMASLAVMAFKPAIRSLWGLGVLSVLAHAMLDYPLRQRPAIALWFFVFVVTVHAEKQQSAPVRIAS